MRGTAHKLTDLFTGTGGGAEPSATQFATLNQSPDHIMTGIRVVLGNSGTNDVRVISELMYSRGRYRHQGQV